MGSRVKCLGLRVIGPAVSTGAWFTGVTTTVTVSSAELNPVEPVVAVYLNVAYRFGRVAVALPEVCVSGMKRTRLAESVTTHGTAAMAVPSICWRDPMAGGQGLTLVNFSAQLKRIMWDRGAFRSCLGGVQEVSGGVKKHEGVFRVYVVSETAQVEQRSGRV